MLDKKMVCLRCGKQFSVDSALYRCRACNGTLDMRINVKRYREELLPVLKSAPANLLHYKAMLPFSKDRAYVTLGEGATPLIECKTLARHLGIRELNIKNEGSNPTGTFKDRCMAVSITKAQELGAAGVILGSAGNAAAAAAAYSARGGVKCFVLVPDNTPLERITQNMMYGAKMLLVDGTVNNCIDMIASVKEEFSLHNVTTASVHNPYQAEGPKTIAYEMAYDTDFHLPDWVLVPVGGGGILYSIYKGFCDLFELGLIEYIPKMAGVQAAGCAAVTKAYRENRSSEEIEDFGIPYTIATAIADPYPLDGKLALDAIRASGGFCESVTDEEILAGQLALSECEGIFPEPASSVTIAALKKMLHAEIIGRRESVACIITGTGLKDIKTAMQSIRLPQKVGNDPIYLRQFILDTTSSASVHK